MSPANSINGQDRDHIINGPRPSPLKINRESHSIQKRQPVIIYTHSPKIIHTQPCDFMALVQKLTGKSRSDDDDNDDQNDDDDDDQSFGSKRHYDSANSSSSNDVKLEDSSSTSVITTEENYIGKSVGEASVAAISSSGNINSGPYFGDVPLFTPTGGGDFFCSPRQPGYRFSDTTSSLSFPSPNLGASLNSPSFLEFIKGLPEY
ncbi:VQ motif-containing protein 20 [Cannabis sativa]|uniref:VQ motif-containing protein 20 n=1 Tax=Cannabis sativa TaxID=3483 RepID=UPI0029CAA6FB|nr:VQ motif-containing protein 20 [Cannabis sativa]